MHQANAPKSRFTMRLNQDQFKQKTAKQLNELLRTSFHDVSGQHYPSLILLLLDDAAPTTCACGATGAGRFFSKDNVFHHCKFLVGGVIRLEFKRQDGIFIDLLGSCKRLSASQVTFEMPGICVATSGFHSAWPDPVRTPWR